MNMEQHDSPLGVLLADLFASDERDLELLVRYAADASSLSAAERAEVEARLDAVPSWRDRLRVLQSFDPAADLEPDASQSAGAVVELGRYRDHKLALWVAVAAAAAFVVWLILPPDRAMNVALEPTRVAVVPIEDREVSRTASTNAEAVIERVRAEKLAAPAPPYDSHAQVVAASGTDNATSVETNSEEIAVNATPLQSLHARQLERRGVHRAEAVAPPRDDRSEGAFDEFSGVQLAMLTGIAYQAPSDRALRVFLGDEMRGGASAVSLEAWVPDHVGQSASPHPKLYWGIEGNLPEAHQLGFVITSETDAEPLFEGSLPVPSRNGIQAVDLAKLGVELTENTVYRWTIFARAPFADPSEDRIAQGWVKFRAAPSSFNDGGIREAVAPEANRAVGVLGDVVVERANWFAAEGYWYDALSLLVGLTERNPGDETARQALNRFLASGGARQFQSIE